MHTDICFIAFTGFHGLPLVSCSSVRTALEALCFRAVRSRVRPYVSVSRKFARKTRYLINRLGEFH